MYHATGVGGLVLVDILFATERLVSSSRGSRGTRGPERGESRSTRGCRIGEGQKHTRAPNRFVAAETDVVCRTSYGGAHRLTS